MSTTTEYAIVTGGGSGIGRAICLELARSGWHIAIADIHCEGSEETLRQVKELGGTGQIERLDVSEFEAWQMLMGRLQREWPQLDLLVNNAGVSLSGPLSSHSESDIRWIVETNLLGVIFGCKTAIPWLKRNSRQGYILNMSSSSGVLPCPRMSVYSAIKRGVVGLSQALYAEHWSDRVSVTAVCPWFTRTELLRNGRFGGEFERAFAEARFADSWLTTEQIARIGLAATFRRQQVCVIGWLARFLAFVERYFPWGYQLGVLWVNWGLSRGRTSPAKKTHREAGLERTGQEMFSP